MRDLHWFAVSFDPSTLGKSDGRKSLTFGFGERSIILILLSDCIPGPEMH